MLRVPKLLPGMPAIGAANGPTWSGTVTVVKMSSSRAASAVMRAISAAEGSTNWLGDAQPPRGEYPWRHGDRAVRGEFVLR